MQKDSDNLKRLEGMRPLYEKLREAQIRNTADAERNERDIAAACAEGRELAGTDDLDALRARITENYVRNTADVDEFQALLLEIDAGVKAAEQAG